MADNASNAEWNENHTGKRVPINDGVSNGAPFSIHGSTGWVQGSVSQVVLETAQLNGISLGADEQLLINREAPFNSIRKYLFKGMQYGKNEDARNISFKNFTGLRGYPTSIIKQTTLELVDPLSSGEVNFDGSLKNSTQSIAVRLDIELRYKVPYDIVGNLQVNINAAEHLKVKYKIEAGNNFITHGIEVEDFSVNILENEWEACAGLHVSKPSSGLTGSQTFTVSDTAMVQEPFYGSLTFNPLIVTEAEYAPASPPDAEKLTGPIYAGEPEWDYASYRTKVDRCNEFFGDDLFPRSQYTGLYKNANAPALGVGTIIYTNINLDTPLANSILMWFTGKYFDSGEQQTVWRIYRYLITDSSGEVTFYEEPGEGYLGYGCVL